MASFKSRHVPCLFSPFLKSLLGTFGSSHLLKRPVHWFEFSASTAPDVGTVSTTIAATKSAACMNESWDPPFFTFDVMIGDIFRKRAHAETPAPRSLSASRRRSAAGHTCVCMRNVCAARHSAGDEEFHTQSRLQFQKTETGPQEQRNRARYLVHTSPRHTVWCASSPSLSFAFSFFFLSSFVFLSSSFSPLFRPAVSAMETSWTKKKYFHAIS